MLLLGWGVAHRLPPSFRLRLVLPNDLLGHIIDQGSAVNEGGGVEGAVLQALLDHFPDGGLREGSGVDLLWLLGEYQLPAGQYSLHLHLD